MVMIRHNAGGLIAGNANGVDIGGGSGTVTNFGTIEFAGSNLFQGSGLHFSGMLPGTVTNAGTIIGNPAAVLFGGGDDLLVADPGAVFIGKVDGGGGNNTLELAPGGGPGLLSGLGTNFVNFGSVVFDANATWTVTLDDPAAFTGTISGFAGGDFIDLTGRIATDVRYSGGVLTVLNGPDVVATLSLAGRYTSADFSLTPDGSGGTDIGIGASEPTADMILTRGSTGDYEIYDLGNNAILGGFPLGQVGTEWQFAGLGNFNGTETSDTLLRNSNTGASRSTTSPTIASPPPSRWDRSDSTGRSPALAASTAPVAAPT